jgi:two-component system, LytTR family, sensor histidine kinase LytS
MADNLSLTLIERMAVLAVAAYMFSHTGLLRRIFTADTTHKEKCIMTLFFGLISISGTYLGIPVEGAIANIRDTGAIVGGLLGGPAVGLGAGLIGGIHRITLGGFTAIPCGITTIIGGLFAGLVHRYLRPQIPHWPAGIVCSVVVISFSMGLILVMAKPYNSALLLVKQVMIPMIMANSLGISIFMLVIHNVRVTQEQMRALQVHRAMSIANQTLPFLRRGLHTESAKAVAGTIMDMTSAEAVAITDRVRILAHNGRGSDHHLPGHPIMTGLTRQVIHSGIWAVAHNADQIGCPHSVCDLQSAVIVPLRCGEDIVGTLKLYYKQGAAITQEDIEFAQGLGQVFSTQIELAKLEKQAALATKAELKALRAQIHPHFLFNALNTIVSLCRTNPEKARELLIHLSEFFRRNLQANRETATLREELEHVDAYLAIEKARYGDRLICKRKIDPQALDAILPILTIQPLVENAVKHGLMTRATGGIIKIAAIVTRDIVEIEVLDNGVGMAQECVCGVLSGEYTSAGIGLPNVNERLKNTFGTDFALQIQSHAGKGTEIKVRVPVVRQGAIA